MNQRLALAWANLPLRTKGLIVVAIPLAALLAATSSLFIEQLLDRRADAAIEQTSEIRHASGQVVRLMVTAESSLRGYLLMRDPEFLEGYRNARVRLPLAWTRFKKLLDDRPNMIDDSQGIGPLIHKRVALLETTLRHARNEQHTNNKALRQLLQRGKQLMDRLRQRFAILHHAETAELAKQQQIDERGADRMLVITFASVAVGLGGGFVAMLLFATGIAGRLQRVRENARRLEQGLPLAPLPPGKDEIGELGQDLEEAAALLSDRRREIHDAKSFLEHLIASSPGLIYRANFNDPTANYVSPNVERLLGYPPDKLTGDPRVWLDHIHPDDRERVVRHFQAALGAKLSETKLDLRLYDKDGRTRWLSAIVRLEYAEDGEPEGVLGYALDVTEQKEAEKTLRQREEMLQAVISASPDIISIVESDGRVRSSSQAFHDILGYDAAELKGQPALDLELIHPDDRAAMAQRMEEVMNGQGQTTPLRLRCRHADGHWVVLEANGRAIRDAEGRTTGLVSVTRDVSAQAELESALMEAKEQAERANNAKSEFLSRMSHELRTPLNAILGFGQLLEMDGLKLEQQESVGQVLRAGRHLLRLIDEVLDIARIEAGRLAISLEPVCVSDAVTESVDMIRPLAVERGIRLDIDPGRCSFYVHADRQRLKQVLLNVLSNAVKYNREGGFVTLSCMRASDNRVGISVTDTGAGIRQQDIPRLFSPFDRLGAENTSVDGTGLGLALSKRLAQAMGGDIRADSVPGEGSTFTIELTLTEGPLERLESASTGVPSREGSAESERSSTILYVEDNLSNLRLIERVLSREERTRLIPAMQGRLGLELAHQHHPDLILLDLHLSDMAGDEVLRHIRQDPELAAVPVIVISADATPGRIQKVLALGATRYLTKPLDIEQFLHVLEENLNERAA